MHAPSVAVIHGRPGDPGSLRGPRPHDPGSLRGPRTHAARRQRRRHYRSGEARRSGWPGAALAWCRGPNSHSARRCGCRISAWRRRSDAVDGG